MPFHWATEIAEGFQVAPVSNLQNLFLGLEQACPTKLIVIRVEWEFFSYR